MRSDFYTRELRDRRKFRMASDSERFDVPRGVCVDTKRLVPRGTRGSKNRNPAQRAEYVLRAQSESLFEEQATAENR